MRSQGPPFTLATQTLEELSDSGQNVPAYHAIAGELAFRLKHLSEAAAHFEAASRLEPTNEMHQLDLAVLRIESTNAEAAAAARATLERLSAKPKLRAIALRWLVAEVFRKGDLAPAERFSSELIADPEAALHDRLDHLDILRASKSAEAAAYLATVQKGAATNAAQAYDMSVWLISHGMVDDAVPWLTNLVATVRNEQPAPLALVDCYLAKKDWSGLQTYLDGQKWRDQEFLRFAFLSRAAAEQKQTLAAEAQWRSAVREAGERLGALSGLLALAGRWGREKACEDLLWQIGQRFPREHWAFADLGRLYESQANTSGLNKLAAAQLSYDPKDFRAQSNLAGTSLLLRLNLPHAHELAREVYSQHPEEAVAVANYAYSLHLQRRTKEGLAVLEKLKPEARETLPVVLYYGVLLAAAGETNQAPKYLEIAQRSRLLPEEKTLAVEAGRN